MFVDLLLCLVEVDEQLGRWSGQGFQSSSAVVWVIGQAFRKYRFKKGECSVAKQKFKGTVMGAGEH